VRPGHDRIVVLGSGPGRPNPSFQQPVQLPATAGAVSLLAVGNTRQGPDAAPNVQGLGAQTFPGGGLLLVVADRKGVITPDGRSGGERIAEGVLAHTSGWVAGHSLAWALKRDEPFLAGEWIQPERGMLYNAMQLTDQALRYQILSARRPYDLYGHTNIAVAAIIQDRVQIGQLGDGIRAYRFRDGGARILIADDSRPGWRTPSGEVAPRVRVEAGLVPGEVIALISRGVWDAVPPERLGQLITGPDPVNTTLRAALDPTRQDNRTILMARITR
jgi:serine/threonine protein phosphatase PrpC